MDIVIPEGMTDAALLAIVIGFLSPLVLNFIVSAMWPSWAKSLVAFAFAAVAGIATALVVGAFDGLSILSTVLLILVISITSYQNFWKQIAPNLQRGTAQKAALVVEEQRREESILAARVVEKVEADVAATPAAFRPTGLTSSVPTSRDDEVPILRRDLRD